MPSKQANPPQKPSTHPPQPSHHKPLPPAAKRRHASLDLAPRTDRLDALFQEAIRLLVSGLRDWARKTDEKTTRNDKSDKRVLGEWRAIV
ncbi:hypothetical protein BU24DRAFT_160055 [Aaosphaeria arxii CBS 175.79]|uniref:Uncharacterized protein n=1 Tax=Aaosphaeria arxii CBS 175.79 TaxID=1450172 RepID=A0A6A5XY11_9PLEO|nr:uncharacterized protein BU24DRAFT_160055 [Aaosphaeria arxii CBS 175.79]KAF2017813.1 hypothetical protein BU24DRAFT_160055 [Aaosphaeria arxii CBS 175.79]